MSLLALGAARLARPGKVVSPARNAVTGKAASGAVSPFKGGSNIAALMPGNSMSPGFGPGSSNAVLPGQYVKGSSPFKGTDNIDMLRPEKSGWELDDDTAGFMTDVFNTLNSPLEDAGYGTGGGGGGGSGGGGAAFQGGPDSEHSVTWDFGRGPGFTPRGLL